MTTPDFLPTASLETLRLRAETLATIRQFFEAAGYWEIETPLLSRDTVVDAYLDPFATTRDSSAGGEEWFLQTSPEFAMKRLLAAGARAIFQIGKVFRQGEYGRLHNPEFTMIEWYRVADDHHAQMDFTELLVRHVYSETNRIHPPIADPSAQRDSGSLPAEKSEGSSEVEISADSTPTVAWDAKFERLTYDAAFDRYAGCPVLDLDVPELRELAVTHDLSPPESLGDDRDGWLNFLLAEIVEPELGFEVPTFVHDYPASQAALAKIRPEETPVAERFELYIQGIEVCNGYHELTDAAELRRRMADQNTCRMADGRRTLPTENRLLAAMEAGLPNCAGVALGFDRLFLLIGGFTSLADVLAFPFDRA